MRRGLFAGSFDPPTLGHLDLIDRASVLCDELYVGVAINSNKRGLLAVEQRIEMLQSLTPAKVVLIKGLLVDFAKENQIDFLIRGLRSFQDLYHEQQLATMNKQLSGIETVFLPGKPEFAHISSSLIRELAQNRAPLGNLVPALIEKKVLDAIKRGS